MFFIWVFYYFLDLSSSLIVLISNEEDSFSSVTFILLNVVCSLKTVWIDLEVLLCVVGIKEYSFAF